MSLPNTTPAQGEQTITLYFVCENQPQPVTRQVPQVSDTQTLVKAALDALSAGPTEEERNAGFSSFLASDTTNTARLHTCAQRSRGFSSFLASDTTDTADIVKGVTITDGKHVTVNFADAVRAMPNASTTNGGRLLIGQLNNTLFQFSDIETIRYEVEGSCDRFWNWLQSTCHTVTRS